MGLFGTLKDAIESSGTATGSVQSDSKGAYWCHDCQQRIIDTEVEGDGPPDCPDCGDAMEFERSPDSSSCSC